MRRARAGLALAFAASLAAAVVGPRTASAGWWDEAVKARETTIDELRAAPDRWRDVPATLVVRFVAATDLAATAGTATEWRSFTASAPTPGVTASSGAASGAPSAPPSGASARQPAAGVAYDGFVVRRGSAEDARLATLRPGDEIRVRAVVRGAARTGASATAGAARPMIEIVWISGAADALSPEELASLARAEDLMRRDNAPGAETLYRSLLDGRDLAPPLCADLWRRIARACRDQRKLPEAAAAYRTALQLDPNDRASRADLALIDDAVRRAATAAAATAAPPADTSGRAVRPLPQVAASEIPVPGAPARLAGPKDEITAAAQGRPAPQAPAASPAAAPASSPASSPAAPPAASPAPAAPAVPPPIDLPPPTRLAPPK